MVFVILLLFRLNKEGDGVVLTVKRFDQVDQYRYFLCFQSHCLVLFLIITITVCNCVATSWMWHSQHCPLIFDWTCCVLMKLQPNVLLHPFCFQIHIKTCLTGNVNVYLSLTPAHLLFDPFFKDSFKTKIEDHGKIYEKLIHKHVKIHKWKYMFMFMYVKCKTS